MEDHKKMPVLIIDDERVNLILLRNLLEREGFLNVHCFSDPLAALQAFDETQPELILLDLMMPKIDGFEVMRRLAKIIPQDEFLPVMVLTADANPETKLKALSSGATDFLVKPLDPPEVLLRVHNLLETRHLHNQLATFNNDLEQTVNERTEALETAHRSAIRQERMRALGTMASGIAHDFNNSLSVIRGFTDLALSHLDEQDGEDHALADYLEEVSQAADDAAALVKRLREFHRDPDSTEERERVDLNEIIEQVVKLTRPRWRELAGVSGRNFELRTLLNENAEIEGEPAAFREMVTNLIFNAVDAMPEGGIITLSTETCEGKVRLEISDTGAGMDEETLERCLEPFFTTKGENGSGLGLAMVFGIVQRHGGEMEIDSEPGQGTTFRFTFPAAARDESAEREEEGLAVLA